MIKGVILHLENDLPVMADLEDLPDGSDVMLRCTNVRLLDGKRPAFVHNVKSVFVMPLARIRVIEIPPSAGVAGEFEPEPEDEKPSEPVLEQATEEAEEDLLARIRQI